uniref:Uncharacterized protein n=1 Tax=Glossina austeni TaxID=7395 RepID=A0A1A9V6P5_GLOAU
MLRIMFDTVSVYTLTWLSYVPTAFTTTYSSLLKPLLKKIKRTEMEEGRDSKISSNCRDTMTY